MVPSQDKAIDIFPISLAICVIASALVANGCQSTRTVSLQEAQVISAKFQDLSLRIPTREIRDPEMDPYPLLVFEKRSANCGAIEFELDEAGGRYWNQRAIAALKVVHQSGSLKGKTLAQKFYLKAWEVRDTVDLLDAISKNYERLGDIVPALTWMEKAASAASGGRRSARMAQLAYLAALAGDADGARKYLSRTIFNSNPDDWTRFWHARGRAAYLESIGRLDEASRQFELARRAIKRVAPDNSRYYRLISHLGWISMKQGRLVEAEALLVNALEESKFGVVSAMPIRNSYSTVLYEQGRYEEAANMAKLNIYFSNRQCMAEDSAYRAEARNNLARAMMALGQWKVAAQQFATIERELQTNPALFEARYADVPDYALSLIRSGSTARAMDMLARRAARLEEVLGPKHYDTVETKAFLAVANAAMGNRDVALNLFVQSVPLMLQRSRQSETHSEGTQSITFKRRTVLESYIAMLADIRGTSLEIKAAIDAASEAFKIADAARSSSVERLLARSSARSAVLDPKLADLARREQDLQRQISAQWASLSSGSRNGIVDDSATNGARENIDDLRAARAAMMEEIERKFPDYADTINPSRISIDEVRGLLRHDERLLSVYIGEEKTFVWSISNSSAARMYVIDRTREEMDDLVAEVQVGLNPIGVATIGDIPEFDVAVGHALFKTLFGEDFNHWQPSETLVYIPHLSLGTLPLAVLPMRAGTVGKDQWPLFSEYRNIDWVINNHDIATLPSVSSLRTLRKTAKTETAQLNFAGFGDPIFSRDEQGDEDAPATRGAVLRGGSGFSFRSTPETKQLRSANLGNLPQLPDTGQEIRELGLVMKANPTRDIFLGVRASEESVKSVPLSGYKVIAFATHGLVPGDLDGLRQPALALSSPDITGGYGDGLLTMDEIMALRLDADWVILSACNTGAADGSGAEAISGLGGAFFYAGARAMLVTYWPVETTSARMITTELFRRQMKDSAITRSEATRQTYRFLIEHEGYKTDKGAIVFTYAHPIFWAAFGLIGLPES